MPSSVFDSAALANAVDLRRRALGRTWAHVSSETHVATSTIRRGGAMEVDGVVWLLNWLGLPFEALVRDADEPTIAIAIEQLAPDDGHPPGAPRWPAYHRFDTAALYVALDQRRSHEGLNWQQVADAIGSSQITTATLKALQRGGRTTVARLVPILAWLGEPAATFTTLPATARGIKSTTTTRQSTIAKPNRPS